MAPKRTLLVLPALGATVIAVAAGTGMLGGDGDTGDVALAGPPATATVEKRTLTRTEKVGGDLGFGDTTGVQAPPAGGGMVTWLPGEGDVLQRGDTVYRVDQRRVPLLYGTIPLYRTLSAGSEGADVRQLERNLHALGYTGFTVDTEYTSSTAAAVRDWQEDLGRTETGRIEPGDAVVSSGARRVAEVATQTGAAASGVLLRWTGTTRVVTVDLDTDYADLVRNGTTATVELPDGTGVTARVTDIGTPTSQEKGGATLPVELAVPDQKKLGRYQVATVQVILAAETREDVLAVPVTALVARSGGGYAVMTGGEYLPVTTGLFSGGYVEISGDGVTEGLSVGVPA
ncbi:peptidoglycan-binding protein [Actinoplanes lobatus]|uniref:Peptidoglycan hydrolase-like protein with peptidoglycan-binding domain n=1 Tax=Actinoplanes lobatus TaxID=113568 RepID=A0A7W7HJ88_9ACTN|nr:peptidoglycan-binding protein [Actinoplanes lobatus]MBB4751541.1 peptidoglycan hydrolase-like protein with peptidoglycan-binding domain [Actinoplanes lobatus]GGN64596.1 peptidoglycan-binding protein [Actinoplanes lobatus]GIE45954.1 peptidoglycan-binding protein [Actinoplanes lobatus]